MNRDRNSYPPPPSFWR